MYRTVPLKFDKIFWWQNGPLLLILALGALLLIARGSPGAGPRLGLMTINYAGRFLPMMMLLCVIMSEGGVLATAYDKEILNFLTNHETIAPLAGSFVAPTPSAIIGVIEKFWKDDRYTANFLYFLNAASIGSLPLFMLRSAGFRIQEICVKMYLFGCITALISFPIRGLITSAVDWIYKLF